MFLFSIPPDLNMVDPEFPGQTSAENTRSQLSDSMRAMASSDPDFDWLLLNFNDESETRG